MKKETKSKLVDETMKYSSDEDVVALYFEKSREELEYNTLIEEAKQNGLKQGIKQGSVNKSIEIAKKMLKKNMSIEDITEITSLTKEEIEKL